MKKNPCLILILFFINLTSYSSAQKRDTIYYDLNWKNCAKPDAKYYRLFTRKTGYYILTDNYISTGKPQMTAVSLLSDSLKRNGKCTYFRENGAKESEGQYTNEARTGRWVWWDSDGKDSSVAEYQPDGTKKFSHLSSGNEAVERDRIFTFVQQMPEFPGGDKALFSYLSKNINYPNPARENGIDGTVLLEFVVNEDGSISDVKALREVSGGCTEEAMRVVNAMPKWKPGVQNGASVKVYFHLPVTFKLSGNSSKKHPTEKQGVIFTTVQQMPQFPGGDMAMIKFIDSKLKYPAYAKENLIEGTVVVQFIVNEDGHLSDLTPVEVVGGDCTEEALRIIRAMPKWIPGVENGEKVRVYCKVPVTFKLTDKALKKKEQLNGSSGK